MNIKKSFTSISCFLLIFILTSAVGVAASETKNLVSVETVEYGDTTYVVEQTRTKNGVRTTKVQDGEDLINVIFNENTRQLQVFTNGQLVSDQTVESDQIVGSDKAIEEMGVMSSWSLLTQKRGTMYIAGLTTTGLAAALATMVAQPFAACLAAASALISVTVWLAYIDSKYVDPATIAQIAMHIKYHTEFFKNSDYTGRVYQTERYEWIYY